jgi:very-short-patch-repair endonuclease
VADASRWLTDLGEVREVVAGAVQHGLCPIELLAEELGQGPRQGSALLRRALAEVADGVRSAAEGQLHALIKRARLPMPLFNPRLFTGQAFLAVPDCWWPEAGVAVEVDSRAWHFSPRSWENTLARHARMAAVGIIVLHFAPRQIYTQPAAVVSRIQSALASARDRSLPQVRTLPAR